MQELQEPWVRFLGQEDPLEEGMAAHSSILAWRIPWTGEAGRLLFTGSQRVGHDWCDLAQHCTDFFATANNAAGNMWVQVSLQYSDFHPFEYIHKVGLLDLIIVLCLIFWGTSILFSIVAIPFYIPTNSVQVFSFLHTLINSLLLSGYIFVYFLFLSLFLFYNGHPIRCEVILNCIYLIISDVVPLFIRIDHL